MNLENDYLNNEMNSNQEVSPTRVFSGDFLQASLVKSLLEANGLQVFLENEYMGLIAPWRVEPGGFSAVKVIVSSTDLQAAQRIVNEFNSAGQEEF